MKQRLKKRYFMPALFLAFLLTLSVTAGCRGTISKEEGAITVVCTIFPAYDWVMNLAGDSDCVHVKLLADSGVDLHSYQPTTADILSISTCDLFIYVGGESDAWVEDVLAEAENDKMRVISLMETLGDGAAGEEFIEGMTSDEGKEDEVKKDEEGPEKTDEPEYDEHVWLSVRNAELFCGVIADELSDMDKAGGEIYRENADDYIGKLAALDEEYKETLSDASIDTALFADRFPFRYLFDDYGISYYAAFPGCSAETEASFETIAFLSEKVEEYGLSYIFVVENSDTALAETIIENTESKDQTVLELNSLQSVSKEQIAEGISYLGIMRGNLDVLAKGLQCRK